MIGAITAFVIVGRQPYLRPLHPLNIVVLTILAPLAPAMVAPVYTCQPPGADAPILFAVIYTGLMTMICGCRDYTARNLGIAIGGVIAATVWAFLAMNTHRWWW